MYIKTEGIVLRQVQYKEYDRILTVLTRDYGKMTIKARGLGRKNSKLRAGCQLLTYSELTLTDYQGFSIVQEAVPLQMFLALRTDLEKLALAEYFAQVSELVAQEDAPNPELLSLLLNALYALTTQKVDAALIKAVFELRMACLAGYMPELEGCSACGSQTPDRFNIKDGSLVCAACSDKSVQSLRVPVSAPCLQAMRYVIRATVKRCFSFRLSGQALALFAAAAEQYLTVQLEHSFPTLDFYKALCLHEK